MWNESSSRAEWYAEFRTDVESYVTREALDACVIRDRAALPPTSGRR